MGCQNIIDTEFCDQMIIVPYKLAYLFRLGILNLIAGSKTRLRLMSLKYN